MRRRFVYREVVPGQVKAIEIGGEESLDARRAPVPTEEIVYGNARATDGTPINSKRKHREYLKATGSAMYSDYSPELRQKLNAERIAKANGDTPQDKRERIEAIRESIEKLKHRRR